MSEMLCFFISSCNHSEIYLSLQVLPVVFIVHLYFITLPHLTYPKMVLFIRI